MSHLVIRFEWNDFAFRHYTGLFQFGRETMDWKGLKVRQQTQLINDHLF